ncbi:MAG: hypothetical protein COA69_01990 [Robiginitomaculum sp.]|nr:MAG: hypothetical protein COA69_01990 [Robiginitomaculum sp.]
MRSLKTGMMFLCIGTAMLASACTTIEITKANEKEIERKKQELCKELETRNQPQCTGNHAPLPPPYINP